MISIIVCSRYIDVSKELKQNIISTIGVEYELIVINNSKNEYSIFSAYNEGMRLAKYPYLCFMHEDIIIQTQSWGLKVIAHFENPSVGIIGIAGSHYIPKLPGAHWSTNMGSRNVFHTIEGQTTHELYRYTDNNDSSLKAVLVDGLWMCAAKSVIGKVRFDDITFSGFHCYDYDICLQIIKLKYDVRIIFDIDIEHFSLGLRNNAWLKNLFIFYNKWKNELPISVVQLTDSKISEAVYSNAREMIEQIRINRFGNFNILRIWIYYFRLNPPTNKRNIFYILSLFKRTIFKKYVSINGKLN